MKCAWRVTRSTYEKPAPGIQCYRMAQPQQSASVPRRPLCAEHFEDLQFIWQEMRSRGERF